MTHWIATARIAEARRAASERLRAEGLRMLLDLGMSEEEAEALMAEARRRGREAGRPEER